MIQSSIKTTIPRDLLAGFGSGSEGIFRRVQMQQLGNSAIALIKARVAKGIGSEDSAMPPLKSGRNVAIFGKAKNIGWAAKKQRLGLQPIRDLTGTGKQGGHMLDNISVRAADETSVKIALTARMARVKALANEKRAPWFSFSDADQAALMKMAEGMFEAGVRQILNKFKKYPKAA
jgi:hypothetical protein